MNDEIKKTVWSLLEYIFEKAEEDRKLRDMLQEAAQGMSKLWADSGYEEPADSSTEVVEELPGTHTQPQSAPGFELRTEQLRWETHESHDEQEDLYDKYRLERDISDAELELIEDRCRMKAEGARWAAMRQRRLLSGADFKTEIEPRDREIIEKAKDLPDCFLWMNHSSGPNPEDLSVWDDVAGCFEAVSSAAALIREAMEDLDQSPDTFEQAMDLAAEAQSALRTAVELVDQNHVINDKDQVKFFQWLRATASSHQIFIERYMRVGDKANPSGWAELQSRMENLDTQLNLHKQRLKQHHNLLSRIRYHISKIGKDTQSDHQDDWHKILFSVDQLISEGFPPSNSDLREELLPIIEEIPDNFDLSANVRLVLREIDRHLALRPTSGDAPAWTIESDEIKEVASLLEGKQVVLIGGKRRLQAKESLEKTFRLSELNWLETTEHQPIALFEPYVGRPEVALVLLAIRWSSHSFGDVKHFCDTHGKPLVRLPGGYNANQIAAQILAQASRQLQEVNATWQ